MISFTMNLDPVAWERVDRGRYGQAYVPKKTAEYEECVGYYGRKIHKGEPLKGPLKVTLNFVLVRPKRPKFELPAVRPDLDNYVKAVTDGLNKIIWNDDAQIVLLIASKIYDRKVRRGRVEVQIEELQDGDVL